MLEIVVVVFAVRAFRALAQAKGLNPTTWAWVGGLSYYLPLAAFGFLVLPQLVAEGYVPYSEGIGGTLLYAVLSIGVGALTALLAYQVLRSRPSENPNDDPTVVDRF